MARHLTARSPLIAALLLAASACTSHLPAKVAGPRLAPPDLGEQVPALQQPAFGGAASTTALGGEKLATNITEAAPPGLHVTHISISPLSSLAVQALHFKGFRGGSRNALINLPIAAVDPQLGLYYLVVPVVNDGDQPARNLKARADFFDASGLDVWTETEPVTYFPTRLGLNPPSLPNTRDVPETGTLGSDLKGFSLYYFAGNVGLFTFSVPDASIASTVRSWTLTFLVSTT